MVGPIKRLRERPEAGPSNPKRVKLEVEEDGVSDESSDDDSEYTPSNDEGKRSRKKKRKIKETSKAQIMLLADDMTVDAQAARDRLGTKDQKILSLIKKALEVAGHKNTSLDEANHAMSNAKRLMALHNIEQADIFAAEDNAQRMKRAGHSIVAITSTSESKPRVVQHAWSGTAAQAMEVFFDCKCCVDKGADRIDWTFYGLAEHTVAAAYAYEMVYNLIMRWCVEKYKRAAVRDRNTYCHGVAEGLMELAEREREAEECRAMSAEETRKEIAERSAEVERQTALDRIFRPVKVEDEKEDGDSDEVDEREGWGARYYVEHLADFDEGGKGKGVKTIKLGDEHAVEWNNAGQLSLFRNNANALAEEYGNAELKLKAGGPVHGPTLSSEHDRRVYQMGKEDGKTIDVKRKRIEKAALDVKRKRIEKAG